VRKVDHLTFMCRLSLNLGALTSCNPQGLSMPVMGLLYLFRFLFGSLLPIDCSCRELLLSLSTRARTHTHTHTFGRSFLDEGSARRRGRYLTTHNTHKRPTTMSPAGFEPTIPASGRQQTHALDFATTGICISTPYPVLQVWRNQSC